FFLGDHGWFDKRLMLDESLTMPMLVRWPAQIPAGTRVTDIVSNVDFAATLLEVAGRSAEDLPDQQGRSFLPQLRGEQVEDWRQADYYRYWEHDDPDHHAPAHDRVRPPPHKHIHYHNDGLRTPGSSDRIVPAEEELYDLVADPQELTNGVHDVAYARTLEQLRALTAQMQAELSDAPYEGPDTPRLEWPTAREPPGVVVRRRVRQDPRAASAAEHPSRGGGRRPPTPPASRSRPGSGPLLPTDPA